MAHTVIPFQIDRPVFVKVPFTAFGGTRLERDTEFKWHHHFTVEKVMVMYNQGKLYHDSEKEATLQVGDGLEAQTIEGLNELVDIINVKVKEKTKSAKEYGHKKCPKSKLKGKQIGMIRRWRNLYGELE